MTYPCPGCTRQEGEEHKRDCLIVAKHDREMAAYRRRMDPDVRPYQQHLAKNALFEMARKARAEQQKNDIHNEIVDEWSRRLRANNEDVRMKRADDRPMDARESAHHARKVVKQWVDKGVEAKAREKAAQTLSDSLGKVRETYPGLGYRS